MGMIRSLGQPSPEDIRIANEFKILPRISKFHSNIMHMLTAFTARPSEKLIETIHPNVRDLCYDTDPPHLPRLTSFFVLQHHPFTLKQRLGALDADRLVKYTLDLVQGLKFLYDHKIVHLDIKSNNLFISERDDLVIGDFGCAAQVDNDGRVLTENIGNFAHLAPEVLRAFKSGLPLPCKKQYSWDLGTILFEMATRGARIVPYLLDRYPDVFDLNCGGMDRPSELVKLVYNLLEFDPNHRMSITDACSYLKKLSMTSVLLS